MSDTHVNAYRMELQEAEVALSNAQAKVASLKRFIKDMDSEESPQPAPKKEGKK